MLQIKCDVCGKVKNPGDNDTVFISVKFQPVYHFKTSPTICLQNYGIKDGSYDLCADCAKTLSRWINGDLGVTKV